MSGDEVATAGPVPVSILLRRLWRDLELIPDIRLEGQWRRQQIEEDREEAA